MKYYAVLKETDIYKRNGGKFDLLYEIPEDFQYKLCFDNLEDATCFYNDINLKIRRTRQHYIFAENKRLIEFDSQYSIEEVLEGKYNTIKDEYSLGEISKHIPRID